MSKKSKISREDIDIFKKAMKGTQLLSSKKIRLSPKIIKKVAAHTPSSDDELFPSHEMDYLDTVSAEELLTFKQPGVSHKILRKLRKGQYNVDAVLDLHGMSVKIAKKEVEFFLLEALRNGLRTVLIIHGKGHHTPMPILKNKLNHWLRETTMVLAFCSAAPLHGNRGAVYVLLKRTTEEKFA